MRKVKLCLSVLGLLVLLLPAVGAAAQVTQQMEIILDASGSMWGRVGGQAKIAVAKNVLVELVESLADRKDLELGIRVYGHQSHRDKHDCLDSRLEIPFGPPNPAAVRALVKRIKAQGYTPIAYSLGQAKNDFTDKEAKKTVVLITDGLESCDGDPCAAARKLFAAGLEVTLHVVGFDLKDEQLAKLKCLVEPSGGLLLGAADADQLKKSLGEVVRKSLAENLVVKVTDTKGKPLAAHIKIFQAGTDLRVAARHGKRLGFKLPAGEYDLVAQGPAGAEKKISGIKLTETDKTEVTVQIGLARLTVSGADLAGKALPIRVGVDAADQSGAFKQITWGQSDGDPLEFSLPAGQYRLRVEEGRTRAKQESQPFALSDGQEKEMKFTFGQARVTVTALDPDGRPVGVTLWVDAKTPTGAYQQRHWTKGKGEPVPLDLPPGNYRVRIREDRTRATITGPDFSLAEGEQKELKFTFGRASLTVTAGDPAGKPMPARVWVDLKQPDGKYQQDKWAGYKGKPLVFPLAPGTYRVRIRESSTQADQTSDDFTLSHGGQKKMHFTFGQTKVTVKAVNPAGQPINVMAFVDRKDASGQYHNEKWGKAVNGEVSFDLPPGEYRVRVRDQATKAFQTSEDFALNNGEQKQLGFTFGKSRVLVKVTDKDGKPIKATVYIERKDAAGAYKSEKYANAGEKPAELEVPPGQYRVRVRSADTKALQTGEDFTLTNGEHKTLTFVFGQARLTVKVTNAEGRPIRAAVYVSQKTATGNYKSLTWAAAGAKPAGFDLPPGEYQVTVQDKTTRAKQTSEDFILKNGEQKKLTYVFGKARLQVTVNDADGKPIKAAVYVNQKTATGNYKSLTWAAAGPKPAGFDLPPGEYQVTVQDKTTKAKQTGEDFTLKNGEQKDLTFSFAQARLTVTVTDMDGKPIKAAVYLDGKNAVGEYKSLTRASAGVKPATFNLPPGEYRVKAYHRPTKLTQTGEDFTLKNGDQKDLKFSFGIAHLSVSGFSPDGKPLRILLRTKRKDATGEYKAHSDANGQKRAAELDLPPGEYMIEVYNRESKETRTEGPITLQHGDKVTKKFTFE